MCGGMALGVFGGLALGGAGLAELGANAHVLLSKVCTS